MHDIRSRITLGDLKRSLSHYVNQAARGGIVTITSNGRPIARIVPFDEANPAKPEDNQNTFIFIDSIGRVPCTAEVANEIQLLLMGGNPTAIFPFEKRHITITRNVVDHIVTPNPEAKDSLSKTVPCILTTTGGARFHIAPFDTQPIIEQMEREPSVVIFTAYVPKAEVPIGLKVVVPFQKIAMFSVGKEN